MGRAGRKRVHFHDDYASPNTVSVPFNPLVQQLLDTLNSSSPPPLSKETLEDLFRTYVRGLNIYDAHQVTAQTLQDICVPLSQRILDAKLGLKTNQIQSVGAVVDAVMSDASISVLDQFLSETSRILKDRDGARLQDYLVIEPPYPKIYNSMIAELRVAFPRGTEDDLEAKCSQALPEAREGEDGSSWTAFVKFIVQYFAFIRDVNVDNLLDTYNLLSELVQ